ncbi:MAG: tryptophan synthase subunit alpha [Clostridiales bacterium]|nr:MAG: tryptophan synthase subunit alpha [Clostridiales bacterium]
MSKIQKAFDGHKAFLAFVTAGDPSLEKTEEYILAMEQAGADLIELGIPFSDPTAEGPVIQDANIRALKHGATVEGVFEMVESLRKKSSIPLVFLTYLNPVFHYGYEAFFTRCEAVGVDGIIIPDLPYEEKGEVADIAAVHGVDLIPLIAPTSEQRIQMIAKEAKGFIYVVSSMGVTGVREEIKTDLASIVAAIRQVTNIPTAIGFGISTPAQAEQMAATSDGAIVGSAIVKIIAEYGEKAAAPLADYVRSMKAAVLQAD